MKSSDDSIQIEAMVFLPIDLLQDSQRSLIDTSSIAVGIYNIQHNNISTKQSPIEPYTIQLSTTVVSPL